MSIISAPLVITGRKLPPVDQLRRAGLLVAGQPGDLLDRHAALGHDSDEGAPQLPGNPVYPEPGRLGDQPELAPGEVLAERLEKPGWAVASDQGVTVALDTTLADELARQGRVHEIVHLVNTMRKEAGLNSPTASGCRGRPADKDLLNYRDWIAAETLAISLDIAPGRSGALKRA